MKTKYKWISFEEVDGAWTCRNHKTGVELGWIEYDVGWRQFVFNPYSGLQFNHECLKNIGSFLDQLNETKGCYKKKPVEGWEEARELSS